MAATGTVAVVPSGKVTFTMEPGSAVPATVSVPFGLAVVVVEGANGAEPSMKGEKVAGETLPAASVSVTFTVPVVCGAADVAEYVPLAATGTATTVPSGNVTLAVDPGSAVPATVSVPFGFAVVVAVGAAGGVVST